MALGACEGDRVTFNSIANELNPQDAISSNSGVDYSQSGGVTQTQVNNLRNYSKNQPYQAMRNLLGSPTRVGQGYETYEIRGSGNSYQAPRRLTVIYQESSDCDYQCSNATDWYEEN